MSVKKYGVSVLLGVFLLSSVSPQAIFALPKDVSGGITQSGVPSLSQEVQKRFLNEKQYLQSIGNPEEYSQVQVQWDQKGQKPSDIRKLHKLSSKDIVGDTKKVLKDFSSVYGINPSKSLDVRLEKDTVSKLTKERHSRLQQFYQNLEIVGGELISHTDKDGFLYQVDGSVDVPTLSTTPTVSVSEALAIGEKEQGKKAQFQILKKPELVLYKFASAYILAYRYTVGYDDPIAHKGQWIYYIDANTGKKINAYNLINDASALTALSGSLLSGEGGGNKTLTGTFDTVAGKYFLSDMSSPGKSYLVFNASSNTGMYTDALSTAQRAASAWGASDPAEISAGYNMAKTLEYYNALGFGISNIAFTATGQTYLPVFVHYGSGYDNAFWSPGVGLYIGDGDGVSLKPLATLDIMAHEFGHAWTENTSKLVYQNEQWALNESFSDISWVSVEHAAQATANNYPNTTPGQADWLIWEDAVIGTKALRDMRNPANTATVGTGNEQPTKYHGTHWYFGASDNGGVHYNSSVQNFFYYLLSDGGSGNNDGILYSVNGIGIAEAWRIAFEANTHFVTSMTDYKMARQAWIDAANSLHPTDPSFANSVKAAWDSVGVSGNPLVNISTPDESFETSTSLPNGYATSVLFGSGSPWTVTTATGAFGSNSLVSWVLANSSANAVTWSWVTSAGYMTFYWRTSSEAVYDTLNFFVDGVNKKSWSGLNPWLFYSDAVTSGSHTFTWAYSKDVSVSGWLDQVGIDAVHIASMTGSLSYSSDTGSGQYVSGAGFHGLFNAPASYDYIVSRSDGQMSKGSASGALSFPLVGLPEWSGSIDFQYRDSNGLLSQIFTQSFFLDSVAPSVPQITLPANRAFSNTGNITLSWNSSTDTGAGLSAAPYTYLISTDSGFTNVISSGSTSATSTNLLLADGTYFARVQARDIAGNTSVSVTSFTVDAIAPLAPTNVFVNHGTVIDATTQTSVAVSGSGGISESGSMAGCIISDASGSASGTGTVDASGTFSFSGINVSTLSDGILTYAIHLTDGAGNTSSVVIGTVGKSAVPAAGILRFLSGSYTNTLAMSLEISAAKPVSYVLSGSDLAGNLTGTIVSSGSVSLPVALTGSDGTHTIQATFTDSALVDTTAFASIVLDRTPPTLSIQSHGSGAQVTGATALLTGSIFDTSGIASATINSIPLAAFSNWSQSVNLVAGNNVFTLTATDNAGNTSSLPITIERLIAISHIASTPLPQGVQLAFDTDLSSTGVVIYGTDSGALNSSQNAISSNGVTHNVTITGLSPDTLYYYRVTASSGVLAGQSSSILSFRTPKIIDIAVPFGTIASTGAVVFSGTSATGTTVFSTTGSLSIQNENSPTDQVSFSFSGLTITPSGTGTWDGIIESPKTVALTGVILPENGYVLTGSVYKAGNAFVSLSFTGQSAMVQIFLGNGFNGKILHVYRSDAGATFALIDTCTVSAGLCQFRTDHFSYFAFWDPNDSTPNGFSFPAKTGVELATNTDSDPITLSGTNVPATISISGGSYSVNSLNYTTATGAVSSGDSIKIRVMSSASNSTTARATLTIWGVSAIFSVTTKAAPVVSSGGGGGWGGGSSPVADTCPNGDMSGNFYDGICTAPVLSSTGITVPLGKTSTWATTWQGVTLAIAPANNLNVTLKNGKKNVAKLVVFQDIESSFAKTYIERLVASRVVSGYMDGKFHPENNITRAEFLKMVLKGLGTPVDSTLTTSLFSDVAESWQIPFVARAKELGIVSGQDINGKLRFRPNDTVTRAEAMKILLLTAGYVPNSVQHTDFADVAESWQIPFVARAKELGIVSGQSIDGRLKFRPNDTMTRAEVAKVIVKMMDTRG